MGKLPFSTHPLPLFTIKWKHLDWNAKPNNCKTQIPLCRLPDVPSFMHTKDWVSGENFCVLWLTQNVFYMQPSSAFLSTPPRAHAFSCHAGTIQCSFSFPVPVVGPSANFFPLLLQPITNGFTDAPSIKSDHATWNVTRTVLIHIELWFFGGGGCNTISFYRLHSSTKSSANAFYLGRGRVKKEKKRNLVIFYSPLVNLR